jgi:glycosyltransferase involved in cell wall biosynthesis
VTAAAETTSGAFSVRVVGEPANPRYGDKLAKLAAPHSNVAVELGYLADSELASEILASEAVVLPYHQLYNSGAALLALTLGRPVVVPATPTMRELREEVGAEWVCIYEGDLTGAVLDSVVTEFLPTPRGALPPLSARRWDSVGRAYAALYRSLRRDSAPGNR